MLGILGIHYDRWLPNSKNLHWEVAYPRGKGREGKGREGAEAEEGKEGARGGMGS